MNQPIPGQQPGLADGAAVRAWFARAQWPAAAALHRNGSRAHRELQRHHVGRLSGRVSSPLSHAHVPCLDPGAGDKTFSRYIARLTGHDPLEIRNSVLPDHARLAASTHLSREARNPDGLAQTLA